EQEPQILDADALTGLDPEEDEDHQVTGSAERSGERSRERQPDADLRARQAHAPDLLARAVRYPSLRHRLPPDSFLSTCSRTNLAEAGTPQPTIARRADT